jgi:hypothetical protein
MVIVGVIFGIVAVVIVTAVGLGGLALPAFIVGFLWAVFVGSSSGASTRIGKNFWIHHRW